MYKYGFRCSFVLAAILLLSACKKDKPADLKPPPVLTLACRLTNYSTDEDLGGNGSQFDFSYDSNFLLVQVTAFTLNGNPGVTVKIGPNGVNRDNGSSVTAWQYQVNIYKELPSVASYTLAAGSTPQKNIENYKYDSKKRLQEVDILDATTFDQIKTIIFTYDDSSNVTSVSSISGNSSAIDVYKATKYDTHPSAYTNIKGRKFMHWLDWWGLLSANAKYIFDIMSAQNILEWTHTGFSSDGQVIQTEKASFVYDAYTQTGYPANRTESYYINDALKATHKDVYSYAGCY